MKKINIRIFLYLSLLVNIGLVTWYFVGNYLTKAEFDTNSMRTGSTWHEEKKALFQVLPAKSDDVVFLGNSIVEQYPLQEYFNSCKVKNRGISGNGFSSLLNRIDQTLVGKPSLIVIEGATNDFFDNKPVYEVYKTCCALIERIKIASPKTKIIILSALPTNRFLKQIKAYNAMIEVYCQKNKIQFVDVFASFIDKNTHKTNASLTADGLHLNGQGYALLTEILKPIIAEYL